MSSKKYRIMIRGEDRTLWCEANNLSYDQACDNGDEYCARYENATWFMEDEDPNIYLNGELK